MSSSPGHRELGQAALEAALTLPLTVFLVLGTLQLFMMLQARVLAQYAVGRAARAGSLHYGKCQSINEAAIATLLPSFHSFLTPGGNAANKYAAAFSARRDNHFDPGLDRGQDGEIVWIERRYANLPRDPEEDFDLLYSPAAAGTTKPITIELKMVFWYPLRIPFADWVMSRMALARYGLGGYDRGNPLIETQVHAGWGGEAPVDPLVAGELQDRIQRQKYSFPIEATYVTRMMTPPRAPFAPACWSGS